MGRNRGSGRITNWESCEIAKRTASEGRPYKGSYLETVLGEDLFCVPVDEDEGGVLGAKSDIHLGPRDLVMESNF